MQKVAVFALWVVALAATAQQTERPSDVRRAAVPTVTRTVLQFSELETALADGLRRRNEAGISKLLTDDFELRTAATPGTPVPRADWIAAGVKHAPAGTQISQMAVRILPESAGIAEVSFLSAPSGGSPQFIVDVWVNREGGWKLAARYSAPSSAQPQTRPTGKE